ncbi:MAG TPA: GntR family transcriptional regulator [Terriglobales bacterium]|nr:GntR family transcriptional regulator [Terriglobales bacterium]
MPPRTIGLTDERGSVSAPAGAAEVEGAGELKSRAHVKDARAVDIPAAVAERIRGLIVRGSLAPGVHLGQVQLAEQFQASRVPVREALKLLAAEGLLVHDPNRGFFVAALSADEARQLYRLRRLIEREVLLTIEWPSRQQLNQFSQMLKEMRRLAAAGQWTEWSSLHSRFHQSIFDLSPQRVLVRETLRLWAQADRYRSLLPSLRSSSGKAGEPSMIDALKNHDREGLIDAFEEERANVERTLLEFLRHRGL